MVRDKVLDDFLTIVAPFRDETLATAIQNLNRRAKKAPAPSDMLEECESVTRDAERSAGPQRISLDLARKLWSGPYARNGAYGAVVAMMLEDREHVVDALASAGEIELSPEEIERAKDERRLMGNIPEIREHRKAHRMPELPRTCEPGDLTPGQAEELRYVAQFGKQGSSLSAADRQAFAKRLHDEVDLAGKVEAERERIAERMKAMRPRKMPEAG